MRDVQTMTAACPMQWFTRTRLLYEHVVLCKDGEIFIVMTECTRGLRVVYKVSEL
jgi:hypothetical protein